MRRCVNDLVNIVCGIPTGVIGEGTKTSVTEGGEDYLKESITVKEEQAEYGIVRIIDVAKSVKSEDSTGVSEEVCLC